MPSYRKKPLAQLEHGTRIYTPSPTETRYRVVATDPVSGERIFVKCRTEDAARPDEQGGAGRAQGEGQGAVNEGKGAEASRSCSAPGETGAGEAHAPPPREGPRREAEGRAAGQAGQARPRPVAARPFSPLRAR